MRPQTLRSLLKRHFEMMAELERSEKKMADLIRRLQENMDKMERLGFLSSPIRKSGSG
ncbi:MAG: hypothetical protein RL549_453 [Verrucomicrobiota bacterium]|jgi:hypothetical protein